MNSKAEVKSLLRESGNFELYSDEVYGQLSALAIMVGKQDKKLKQFWENLEGMKEQYIHDLFVKNKQEILRGK